MSPPLDFDPRSRRHADLYDKLPLRPAPFGLRRGEVTLTIPFACVDRVRI